MRMIHGACGYRVYEDFRRQRCVCVYADLVNNFMSAQNRNALRCKSSLNVYREGRETGERVLLSNVTGE